MSTDDQRELVLDTDKGPARIVQTDGQNVTLHAAFVAPPGCPLQGVLRTTDLTLRIKVHGCRRTQPDVFELTGRWVSLSRQARLLVLGQAEPT
ncbi:MAG: hypothetical protein ACM3ZE_12810 [Myxococcales bacterium]